MSDPVTRVLFVCVGNICRSPMAAALFQQLVEERGLEERFVCDSAGTAGWNAGDPAHPRALDVLQEHGIDASYHRARRVTEDDLESFDRILVMDAEILRDVQSLGSGRAVVELLLQYSEDAHRLDVPDPFVTGGFAASYTLLKGACEGLLQALSPPSSGDGN